jgi:hypothetical protein
VTASTPISFLVDTRKLGKLLRSPAILSELLMPCLWSLFCFC